MNNRDDENHKIISVDLDDSNLPIPSHEAFQERNVAIFDLLSENFFKPIFPNNYTNNFGPYKLNISIKDQLLIFKISNIEDKLIREIILSISPIRKILKDYNEICVSYYNAVKRLPPSQIETIDMGRKAIHDEGGKILVDRFNRKAEMDLQTARRLFTLITAIYLESNK